MENNKKIKKNRSARPLKKYCNAYIFFTQHKLNLLRQISPESNLQDKLKEIAKEWASLNDEEKKPFEELASNDKSRYYEEKRLRSDILPSNMKTKKTKISGFLCFCNEMRPIIKKENPEANCITLIKELAHKWRLLPDESRKEFETKASHQKKILLSCSSLKIQSFFSRYKKSKNSTKFFASPFLLFCRRVRSKNPEKKGVFFLADLWNNLNEEQKKEYYEIYRKEKEKKRIEEEETEKNKNIFYLENKKNVNTCFNEHQEEKNEWEPKTIQMFLESEKSKNFNAETKQTTDYYKVNDDAFYSPDEKNKNNYYNGDKNKKFKHNFKRNYEEQSKSKKNQTIGEEERKKRKMVAFLKDCETFLAIKRKLEKEV